jgi:hypothetical protein
MHGKREIWALYLPQFYETKENNEWWGKGYTEWTSVKNATPLYPGHVQPLVPLHKNYYDLSDAEVMREQASLARKYSITNFVMYHYWYEGRHLLEKPAENLLTHGDIDFPYCFCWANHSWTRAWDGKDHEILMKQTYGDKEEWEEHLQYLLPFFRDERYKKIDNKPVFFIYRASSLDRGNERIGYWNKRLREEGFNGIYIVEYISTFNPQPNLRESQAVFEDNPNYVDRFEISLIEKGIRFLRKKTRTTDYQDFDRLWKLILNNKQTYGNRKIVQGAFGMWDNSPRKGKNSRVVRGVTPEKLQKYLTLLLMRKRADESNVVVYNAWNEWGEGATLEPTEQDGYGYLDAVKAALDAVSAGIE